jgi:hypothetical protein
MPTASKPELRLAFVDHAAAKHAVERWHYSRTLPVGRAVMVGVWEAGKYIGVVIFSWGSNKDLGTPYGLQTHECSELVRVALSKHKTQVSRIMAVAVRMLRATSPGVRLLVSFADPVQGHHGGIYQAMGWLFAGQTSPGTEWRLGGKRLNKRAFTGANFGQARMKPPPGAIKVAVPPKLRYLYPMDDEMRQRVAHLAKPYPKRAGPQGNSGVQPETGGAGPTPALHPSLEEG